ncbi:ABC transporter permease, partial [Salmonella enterica subsp. enterica serovar Newport]|nr:ABC transporter permease [Salmonella enterica subsp. enterica serovar Newport]
MTIEYVGWVQVVLGILARFWPVWLAMAVTLGLSVYFRKKLG